MTFAAGPPDPSGAQAQPSASPDPTLTMAGIDTFFDSTAARAARLPPRSADDLDLAIDEPMPVDQALQPKQSVASMIHGFVADFQKLAKDFG